MKITEQYLEELIIAEEYQKLNLIKDKLNRSIIEKKEFILIIELYQYIVDNLEEIFLRQVDNKDNGLHLLDFEYDIFNIKAEVFFIKGKVHVDEENESDKIEIYWYKLTLLK